MKRCDSVVRTCLMTVFVLLLAACAGAPGPTLAIRTKERMPTMTLPDDLDTSTTRLTDKGQYRVTVTSKLDPIVINRIHNWMIHVERDGGTAVEDAEISVDGGMPQHGHGLPTAPQVTESLGDGDYLLEGVKFQMTGWWELKLRIIADSQTDTVTFNIVLE